MNLILPVYFAISYYSNENYIFINLNVYHAFMGG